MAHSGSTTTTGITTNQNPSPRTVPVLVSIGQIMERARSSSEGIVRIVALYEGMLAGANPDMLTHLNSVAAPMLRGLQQDLRYQQQQMATYADVMNPNSEEYNITWANAEQA